MSMMRSVLLKASENSWLRERAPRYRFIRRSVERFLPGEKLEDALAAAKRLAERRIDTLLTHLGENVADRAEAEAVTSHYLQALDRIRAASAAVGNLGEADAARPRSRRRILLRESREAARGTRAESSRQSRLDRHGAQPLRRRNAAIYIAARGRRIPNVGVCVQAYLYRTEKDLRLAHCDGRDGAPRERRLQRAL